MRDATHSIVNNYHRLCAWLDVRDLEQEAELAKLQSAPHWNPGGAPLEAYQAMAMAYSLRSYVARMRAPVSAGHNNLEALNATFACEIDDAFQAAGDSGIYEHGLDIGRASMLIQAIMTLLDDDGIARAVLIEEQKPADVARARNIHVAHVYRAVRVAREAIAAEPHLRAYGEELR